MILLASAVALAATRVTVTGPLRPGVATELLVGSVDDGRPVEVEPKLRLEGATLRSLTELRPGVWRGTLVPQPDAQVVRVTADGVTAEWPVLPPPRSALVVPDVVDALAGPEPVRFLVSSPTGVAARDLVVIPGEGTVVAVRDVEEGVEVELLPDDLPFPRWIAVGVRDLRADERPAWVRVRLRARPRIPLQAEAGAVLTLAVGGRAYGPFESSATGALEGRVDQYPGELVASALLVDDLGNETRTDIPLLAGTDPLLVAVPTGDLLPGRTPPVVHLLGLQANGSRATEAPTCGAAFGDLPVVRESSGVWLVPVPALDPPQDLRVACSLGPTRVVLRVPVAAGVPAELALRVWPQDLRADLPWAEVRVTLEDWRGERLPVRGVEVTADGGTVTLDQAGGIVLGGTYDGTAAASTGQDVVHARYVAEAGVGPPAEVRFGWTDIPELGPFQVHVRVLDAERRPVSAPVRVRIGAAEVEAITGPDGWATVSATSPDGEPIEVVAFSGGLEHRWLLLPGEAGAPGPGAADLAVTSPISLRPGRASGLDLQVQPPILRAAPGAVAFVTVRLEDGAGQPITDEDVQLTASEGSLGELRKQPDGSFLAEYTPPAIADTRQVEITATTQTVHTSTRLQLEPRVVRLSLGPWVGASTNFGPTLRAVTGLDLDVRTRTALAGEALMVRASVSASSFSHTAPTGVGPDAELRSTVVPVSLAVLFRGDRGAWSTWGGVGGAVGLHHLQVRFGDELVSEGDTPLFGPELHGALARRAVAGEVALSLRGTWLPATTQEIGYTGNLGGVALSLGYRLVW